MHFESVAVCHLKRVRGIRWLHSRAVKQESHRVEGLALALAKGRHELLELGAALDLEEDLVVVVGDLDVEVLGVGRRVLAIAWRLVVVVFGHVFCVGFVRARACLFFRDAVSGGFDSFALVSSRERMLEEVKRERLGWAKSDAMARRMRRPDV